MWDAADGARAADLYRGYAPEIAVVLLGARTPRLDGPQTLAALKRHTPGVPVCFMSGALGEHAPGELLRLGARHLFPKPLLMSELAEGPHEIVATWRARFATRRGVRRLSRTGRPQWRTSASTISNAIRPMTTTSRNSVR